VNGSRGPDNRWLTYAVGPMTAANDERNRIEPTVHLCGVVISMVSTLPADTFPFRPRFKATRQLTAGRICWVEAKVLGERQSIGQSMPAQQDYKRRKPIAYPSDSLSRRVEVTQWSVWASLHRITSRKRRHMSAVVVDEIGHNKHTDKPPFLFLASRWRW